jgi:hypothetical protein
VALIVLQGVVKMAQIVALSKYGFKVDSLKNEWEKVDKSLLKRDCFLQLQKGDSINIVARNKEGFIMEFNKEPTNIFNELAKPFMKATDERNHDKLKGKCLNIACNAVFSGQNIGFDNARANAIKYAQRLLVELEEADYYKW